MDKHYTVSDGTLVLFLWPAEEGGYCVTSPLDPALITQGETIEEAFEMAYDALETLRAYRAERDAGAPDPEKPKRRGSSKRPKAPVCMKDKLFEFIVSGFVQGDHATVIGRCGDVMIRIGDTFDSLQRYRRPKTLEDCGNEPVLEAEVPVSLRVTCVHAYGRSLDALGEGMTGSLALEGEGLEKIAPGWVLGRQSEELTRIKSAAEAIETS